MNERAIPQLNPSYSLTYRRYRGTICGGVWVGLGWVGLHCVVLGDEMNNICTTIKTIAYGEDAGEDRELL